VKTAGISSFPKTGPSGAPVRDVLKPSSPPLFAPRAAGRAKDWRLTPWSQSGSISQLQCFVIYKIQFVGYRTYWRESAMMVKAPLCLGPSPCSRAASKIASVTFAHVPCTKRGPSAGPRFASYSQLFANICCGLKTWRAPPWSLGNRTFLESAEKPNSTYFSPPRITIRPYPLFSTRLLSSADAR